jgi:hypothetical protein
MKTLTGLLLNGEYECFQLVGNELIEIDSLIGWQSFHIDFEYFGLYLG